MMGTFHLFITDTQFGIIQHFNIWMTFYLLILIGNVLVLHPKEVEIKHNQSIPHLLRI
jgi:hypothetical protein